MLADMAANIQQTFHLETFAGDGDRRAVPQESAKRLEFKKQ